VCQNTNPTNTQQSQHHQKQDGTSHIAGADGEDIVGNSLVLHAPTAAGVVANLLVIKQKNTIHEYSCQK